MTTVSIVLRLKPNEREALHKEAETENVSLNTLVRSKLGLAPLGDPGKKLKGNPPGRPTKQRIRREFMAGRKVVYCYESGPVIDGLITTCMLANGHEGPHQWRKTKFKAKQVKEVGE